MFLLGWAATVTFNPKTKAEFDRFLRRDDTLSLGVCNGCQLLALLGWVGEGAEDGAGMSKVVLENTDCESASVFSAAVQTCFLMFSVCCRY